MHKIAIGLQYKTKIATYSGIKTQSRMGSYFKQRISLAIQRETLRL